MHPKPGIVGNAVEGLKATEQHEGAPDSYLLFLTLIALSFSWVEVERLVPWAGVAVGSPVSPRRHNRRLLRGAVKSVDEVYGLSTPGELSTSRRDPAHGGDPRGPAPRQPGQKVLIIGAAGGVGTLAVQIAKAFGGEVTGVCSSSKVDLVRSIGADEVIDYTREDFADGARRWVVIVDRAGRHAPSSAARLL